MLDGREAPKRVARGLEFAVEVVEDVVVEDGLRAEELDLDLELELEFVFAVELALGWGDVVLTKLFEMTTGSIEVPEFCCPAQAVAVGRVVIC